MFTIQTFVLVFLGGGLGASLRFSLSSLINSMNNRIWLGTLFVNILGCVIYFFLSRIGADSRDLMSFFKIGLLGSLTTFSTFSFEVVSLFKLGHFIEGGIVIFLNMFFGIMIGIGILS